MKLLSKEVDTDAYEACLLDDWGNVLYSSFGITEAIAIARTALRYAFPGDVQSVLLKNPVRIYPSAVHCPRVECLVTQMQFPAATVHAALRDAIEYRWDTTDDLLTLPKCPDYETGLVCQTRVYVDQLESLWTAWTLDQDRNMQHLSIMSANPDIAIRSTVSQYWGEVADNA